MVLSSYYNVARYDDDSTRNFRARNLDDIRAQIRANITRSRFQSKSIKMLQNRRTLVEAIATTLVYLKKEESNSCDCSTSGSSDNAKYWQDDYEESETGDTQAGLSSPQSSEQYDYYHSEPSTPDELTLSTTQEQWFGRTCDTTPDEANDYTLTNNDLQYLCSDRTLTPHSISRSSSPWSDTSNTTSAIHQSRSNSPSQLSPLCVEIDGCPVPTYFLEAQPTTSLNPQRPKTLSINQHQQAYKQSSSSPRVSSQATLDMVKIKNDFEQFKQKIENSISDGAQQNDISTMLKTNWPIITNSFQTMESKIISSSIELLCNLISANLIDSDTMCHVLQNGLIFSLKSSISQIKNGLFQVIKLILNIARSNTAILPYMIDLIYHSKLFNEFEVALRVGSNEDIRLIVEFYYIISETLMHQITSNEQDQQPILPNILLRTGTNSETKQTYSHTATMAKCYSTNLINNLTRVGLNRANQREEEIITMTLIVLANAIKLAHLKSSTLASQTVNNRLSIHHQKVEQLWIIKTLCAFRDSNIELKLDSLIKALQRLQQMSENSDQCSQGVGTDDVAARNKQQCQQFLEFYQNYYKNLFSTFEQQLDRCCCSLSLS